jgi:hypothetical protein
MSNITELASGQINGTASITTNSERPTKPPPSSSFDGPLSRPCCTLTGSQVLLILLARTFAAAVVKLAQIRPDRKL